MGTGGKKPANVGASFTRDNRDNPTKNHVGASSTRDSRTRIDALKEVAREVLFENGEFPDHWIMAGREAGDKLRFLCAAPPFPVWEGAGGPLLDSTLGSDLSLAMLLTLERGEIETLVCGSFGYLGNLLCEGTFEPDDFPEGYVELVRSRRRDQPEQALRAAIREMVHLGYSRLTSNTFLSFSPHPSSLVPHPSIRIAVRPDGGLAMGHFRPEATLNELSGAMANVAAKAKLTRLRQSAKNCGGCGRCCHDPNIPLTFFDVRSVASHKFAELYRRNPDSALARAHEILAFAREPEPGSMLPVPNLYFRKKDGSNGANSPCVFLDGRGLCGVYEGRPLLCRLYHCAEPSVAVENLYKSAFATLEWLGRVVESGLLRPAQPINLPELLELPLVKLASPYALMKVAQELAKGKPA